MPPKNLSPENQALYNAGYTWIINPAGKWELLTPDYKLIDPREALRTIQHDKLRAAIARRQPR